MNAMHGSNPTILPDVLQRCDHCAVRHQSVCGAMDDVQIKIDVSNAQLSALAPYLLQGGRGAEWEREKFAAARDRSSRRTFSVAIASVARPSSRIAIVWSDRSRAGSLMLALVSAPEVGARSTRVCPGNRPAPGCQPHRRPDIRGRASPGPRSRDHGGRTA